MKQKLLGPKKKKKKSGGQFQDAWKETAFTEKMKFEPRADNLGKELAVQRVQQPQRRQEESRYMRTTLRRQG